MRLASVVIACLLAAGCSNDATLAPHPDFSITATPADVLVPQGGAKEVLVRVTRKSGFTDPIRITVQGLPGGVDATTLSFEGSTLTGSLVLSAPPNVAVPQRVPVLVQGSAASATRSSEIDLRVRGKAGTLDPSFDGDGMATSMFWIRDAQEEPGGSFLVTGDSMDANHSALGLCRFTPDGALDPAFATGGCLNERFGYPDAGGCRVVEDRGAIYLAGWVLDLTQELVVARFDSEGHLDPGFGAGKGWERVDLGDGYGWPYDLILLPDGRILVAGQVPDAAFLVRLKPDGQIDDTFASLGVARFGNGNGALSSVRLDSGRIVATDGDRLYGFTGEGAPDPAFGSVQGIVDPLYFVDAMDLQNGDLVTTGDQMDLERYSATGAVEATWPPSCDGLSCSVEDLEIAADGSILSAGMDYDLQRVMVARRTPDGLLDDDFAPGGVLRLRRGFGTRVKSLSDGRILVVGRDYDLNAGLILRLWN